MIASVTSFNVFLVVMMACCVSTFAQTTVAPLTIADQTTPDQTPRAAPDSPATPAAPDSPATPAAPDSPATLIAPAPGDSSESSEEPAPAAPAPGVFSSKSSEEPAPAAPTPDQTAEPGAPTATQAAGAPANGATIGPPAGELVVGTELSENDASRNQLPRKSSHLHSGRMSSASNAGIAVAVIALIGLVMGSAIFVIKNYRKDSPVFSEL